MMPTFRFTKIDVCNLYISMILSLLHFVTATLAAPQLGETHDPPPFATVLAEPAAVRQRHLHRLASRPLASPVLDAKDRSAAVSQTLGGWFDEPKRDLNQELFGNGTTSQVIDTKDSTREVSLSELADLSELTEEQAKVRVKVTNLATTVEAIE